MNYIKSPLNYIGGKFKLLDQIIPLFPENITNFVDLFSGGCNVSVNINAVQIYCNDNITYLIDLLKKFKELEYNIILSHIESRINEYNLSFENEKGYQDLRKYYNNSKNPLDLFVLISYSFNHQIRFNNKHEFNNPFGKERSSFNETIKYNLERFIFKLHKQNIIFTCNDFKEFDYSILSKDDFIYCDPPYLITTGSYNDGKRGFKGWTEKEEKELLNILENLNKNNIKFGLSNVIEHKGKKNEILINWIKNNNFTINYINTDYSNSNYQTKVKDKNSSVEVFISNYEKNKKAKMKNLF